MSLEDLRRMRLLRDEREWGEDRPATYIQGAPFVTALLGAIAACVLLVVGDGSWLTWVGLLLFFATLAWFLWLNIRGVFGG